MIHQLLTLTLNPALDVSSDVERVVAGPKLRCGEPRTEPGGGGVNVARAARRLGANPTALLTSGGSDGEELENLLAAEGVLVAPIRIAGSTRRNFSVFETATALQYRFGLPGPTLSSGEWERVLDEVTSLASSGWFVVSGALAPGMPADFYRRLIGCLRARRVRIALDCSGEPLRQALGVGVDLVKPNVRELEGFVGRPLTDLAEIEAAAREILTCGPTRAVVVSMAGDGALVVARNRRSARLVRPPSADTRSTIGAGDSMMAGMVVALGRGERLDEAVRVGVAAGTAAVSAPGTQLCHAEVVAALLPSVTAEIVPARCSRRCPPPDPPPRPAP